MNTKDLSDQELYDLHQALTQEQSRRFQASIAVEQSDRSIRAFREVNEREQGAEWEPPLRPVDAYFTGDLVTLDEVTYESQRDFNYLKPGEDATAWSPQSES